MEAFVCSASSRLAIGCDWHSDGHYVSHPTTPLLVLMCWKIMMHSLRPVPDVAENATLRQQRQLRFRRRISV